MIFAYSTKNVVSAYFSPEQQTRTLKNWKLFRLNNPLVLNQGDQIGRICARWVFVYVDWVV
jgi:hypothetical protein